MIEIKNFLEKCRKKSNYEDVLKKFLLKLANYFRGIFLDT